MDTEILYDIKEARYQIKMVQASLKEASWHEEQLNKHLSRLSDADQHLVEAYENYMAANCTCSREEGECPCVSFPQFCDQYLKDLEEAWAEMAHEEQESRQQVAECLH